MEKHHRMLAAGRATIFAAVDVLLPPRCLRCGRMIGRSGALCPRCWQGMRFITPPCCAQCGFPFSQDEGEDVLCGACLADPPPFSWARSALAYDSASRPLILDLKHRDRHEGVDVFSRWLRMAGGQLLQDADAILPVPLHRWRLIRRRFNQSALMAQALARDCGLDYLPQVLVRTRRTPSQGGRNRRQRLLNVRGAFSVPAARKHEVTGRHLILIDDVYTTGATVFACSRALTRAGAASVGVLTLARVLRRTP